MPKVTFSGLHTDRSTGYLVAIDPYAHYAHEGDAFFWVHSSLADDTDTIEVRIQTPDTPVWAHISIGIDGALASTAEMWSPTTMTHVAANLITPFNRNNNSTSTSGLTICHTPGGSQAGNPSLYQYLGAATTSGKGDVGGGTGSRGEFIFAQNSSYLIRMTSRADANALSIILSWSEHEHE